MHRLTQKNLETMTAYCEVDGWTAIGYDRSSRKHFCKKGRNATIAKSKESHPESRKKNRGTKKPSAHRLVGTTCQICGPVQPAAWGRGYMCPNRMKELGWVPQEAPTPKCSRCQHYYLNRDGKCPSCDDREATDVAHGLRIDADRRQAYRLVDGDFHLSPPREQEPELDAGFDSVDSSLPVIGSSRPWNQTVQVRPEYAAIYLAGRASEGARRG